jgi:hypothetical protein
MDSLPSAAGLSWQEWMRAVAWHIRTRLTAHPELIDQLISGTLHLREAISDLEFALNLLTDAGFSTLGALDAYMTVGQFAVGSCTDDIREAKLLKAGRPMIAQMHAALAVNPDEFRHLGDLLRKSGTFPDRFDQRLDLILAGIAVTNGLDVEVRPRKRRTRAG